MLTPMALQQTVVVPGTLRAREMPTVLFGLVTEHEVSCALSEVLAHFGPLRAIFTCYFLYPSGLRPLPILPFISTRDLAEVDLCKVQYRR